MTNGEKLIEIFPNNSHISLKRTTQFVINPMTINQHMIVVDNDFWNAEYKDKKDCNTCTHGDETDGSNCYECVKDMCNNYEPTTKNDLGVDCISREAVLDVIEREQFKGDAISEIEKLSSVTPQEPRWIPCSERLPEEGGDYLVTVCYDLLGKRTVREVRINFFCILSKKWLYEDDDVIAWMPSPDPYREVEE